MENTSADVLPFGRSVLADAIHGQEAASKYFYDETKPTACCQGWRRTQSFEWADS